MRRSQESKWSCDLKLAQKIEKYLCTRFMPCNCQLCRSLRVRPSNSFSLQLQIIRDCRITSQSAPLSMKMTKIVIRLRKIHCQRYITPQSQRKSYIQASLSGNDMLLSEVWDVIRSMRFVLILPVSIVDKQCMHLLWESRRLFLYF